MLNAGSSVVSQERFETFGDYQNLIDEVDEVCERVMVDVYRHATPGTRESRVWRDAS